MADVSVFDWVCAELEENSSLNKLESRGTIRIVLREAGLEARTVTQSEMQVAVSKVLPAELSALGSDYPAALEYWEPHSIMASGLSLWFWHELFMKRPLTNTPPNWQELWP